MRYFILFIILFFAGQLQAQNGISWNMSTDVFTGSYGNSYPRLAVNGSGNPVVVWGDMMNKDVYFSRWTGSAFSTPLKLNPSWLKVASASWMGPDIATKGDTIYVVVKRMPETADTNRVFIFRSFNGGQTFDAPVELAFIADNFSRFPTVAVDELGNPIVAYMKFDPMFMNSHWVVTRSSDFGNTFSPEVIASGYSGMESEACDCCPGALVASGSNFAMLFRDNLEDTRDIWTGISTDNGNTFPSGFEADDSKWMVMSCPASGPDGVIIGDTLYSTFMSAGMGNYRTFLSRSSLSSGALITKNNLTGPITGLSQQNYPRIAADGKAMAIVWKQTVSSLAQVALLFTTDIAAGFPSKNDTVDLANVTNTDVVLSNGNIFVIWQDDQSQTVKYRHGTYTPALFVQNPAEHKLRLYPNPATNMLNIEAPFAGQNGQIKIYDIFGKLMVVKGMEEKEGAIMDIRSFSPGIYFVCFEQNGLIFTNKFIKK